MRFKEIIAEAENPQYITLWHGGRDVESSYDEVRSHKSDSWEHGPGLYLTTHFDTAAKYAKGGGKLYKVTVERGTEMSDVNISLDDALGFVNRYVKSSKRKAFADDLRRYVQRVGFLRIEVLVNLCKNYNAIQHTKTNILRQFLIDHGVDYIWVNHYGGRPEKVMVLVNPKKIKKIEIVPTKNVNPDEYELSSEFNEGVIEEGRDAPLYHSMFIRKALECFATDVMPARWTHSIPQYGKVRGNSFTRNDQLNSYISRSVVLVVDQTKLAQTNKIVPLDGERVFRHSLDLSDLPQDDQADALSRGKLKLRARADRADHTYDRQPWAEEFVVGDIKRLHRCITSIVLDRTPDTASRYDIVQLYDVTKQYCEKYGIEFSPTQRYVQNVEEIQREWKEEEEEESELTEAPVGDWNIDPDFESNEQKAISGWNGYVHDTKHWPDADKKAMRDPAAVKRIRDAFNKVPATINVYFYQSADRNYDRTLQAGVRDMKWVADTLGNTAAGEIAKSVQSDAITFVMTNNLSDESWISIRSPWMLAHRMAHSLISGERRLGESHEVVGRFNDFVHNLLKVGYGYKWPDPEQSSNHYIFYKDHLEIMMGVMGKTFGTMRSARTGKLTQPSEWMYETFVQYLMSGKVTINPLPEVIDVYHLTTNPRKLAQAKVIWKQFPENLKTAFDALLHEAQGKVWIE